MAVELYRDFCYTLFTLLYVLGVRDVSEKCSARPRHGKMTDDIWMAQCWTETAPDFGKIDLEGSVRTMLVHILQSGFYSGVPRPIFFGPTHTYITYILRSTYIHTPTRRPQEQHKSLTNFFNRKFKSPTRKKCSTSIAIGPRSIYMHTNNRSYFSM